MKYLVLAHFFALLQGHLNNLSLPTMVGEFIRQDKGGDTYAKIIAAAGGELVVSALGTKKVKIRDFQPRQ